MAEGRVYISPERRKWVEQELARVARAVAGELEAPHAAVILPQTDTPALQIYCSSGRVRALYSGYPASPFMQEILRHDHVVCAAGIQNWVRNDEGLAALGAESCVSHMVKSDEGVPLAYLCAFDMRPLAGRQRLRDILERYAEEVKAVMGAETGPEWVSPRLRLVEGVLNAMPAHVAALDTNGVIILVNEAWRRFAEENGMAMRNCGVGANYLSLCENAGEIAAAAAQGIRRILAGEENSYHAEYSCDGLRQRYWFQVRVAALDLGGARGAIVAHEDITALKDAGQELARAKEQLEFAIEGGELGVWYWDIPAERVYLSGKARTLIEPGAGPLELDYGRLESLIHPADIQAALEAVRRHIEGQAPSFEARLRIRDHAGGYRWFLTRGRVANGGPETSAGRAAGTYVDITETVRAQEATAKSEARLAGILDIAGDAIISTDVSGRILMFNRSAEKIFGYSAQEIIGEPLEILLPEPDRTIHSVHMKRFVSAAEASIRMESRRPIRGRRKDGSLFPAEASLSKLTHAGETILTVYLRDITARKLAEEELTRLGRILDSSQHEIYVCDYRTYRILYSNQCAQEIHAHPPAELLNQPLYTLEPACAAEDFERRAAPLLRREVRCLDYETEFVHKDGGVYPVSVRIQLATQEDPPVLLAFVKDISERKRLEQQLSQAQRLEAIGRFTGGIAHDFNNLLLPITVYTDMLLDTCPADAPERPHLEEIRKCGERATSLVRRLMAFSRQQVTQPIDLQPASVIREMEQMLRPIIGDRIRMVIDLAPDTGWVKADPSQFEQVVMNLVVNARDAMPEGGLLTIRTRNVDMQGALHPRDLDAALGPYVLLQVSDTGVGMSKETRSRIFEPFFTTKPPGKGSGIGLSTVYGIVKQSGGQIWVYTEPGQGTTFKIYLPRIIKNHENQEAAGDRPVSLQGHETILLVEDAPPVRNSVAATLRQLGYSVLVPTNAMHALDLLKVYNERIDLMLTDVLMPDLKGTELARYAKTLRPGIPILFMSGFLEEEDESDRELVESEYFIDKPFSTLALGVKLRAILDERSATASAGPTSPASPEPAPCEKEMGGPPERDGPDATQTGRRARRMDR